MTFSNQCLVHTSDQKRLQVSPVCFVIVISSHPMRGLPAKNLLPDSSVVGSYHINIPD